MSLAEFFDRPTVALLADEIVMRQIAAYDPTAVDAAVAEFTAPGMTAAEQARPRRLPAIDPDIRMADGERGA